MFKRSVLFLGGLCTWRCPGRNTHWGRAGASVFRATDGPNVEKPKKLKRN